MPHLPLAAIRILAAYPRDHALAWFVPEPDPPQAGNLVLATRNAWARMKKAVGKTAFFPTTFRPCRTRRQVAEAKMRIAAAAICHIDNPRPDILRWPAIHGKERVRREV
jgi:hypothetical protein